MTSVTVTNKTGRRSSGTSGDGGIVTHARINGSYKALCGTEPGKRGGWSEYPKTFSYERERMQAVKATTCKRCKTRLNNWGDKPRSYSGGHLR